MYAVVVRVSIASGRTDEAVGMLDSVVIPMLKSQAGHVARYFTRSDDGSNGLSMSVFGSKEQAEASAATVAAPPGAPVTIESAEVREVIASA
jgi:hypothetical protein